MVSLYNRRYYDIEIYINPNAHNLLLSYHYENMEFISDFVNILSHKVNVIKKNLSTYHWYIKNHKAITTQYINKTPSYYIRRDLQQYYEEVNYYQPHVYDSIAYNYQPLSLHSDYHLDSLKIEKVFYNNRYRVGRLLKKDIINNIFIYIDNTILF